MRRNERKESETGAKRGRSERKRQTRREGERRSAAGEETVSASCSGGVKNVHRARKHDVRGHCSGTDKACVRGRYKGFEALRDTSGEKPTDKVEASVTNENKELMREYLESVKKGK